MDSRPPPPNQTHFVAKMRFLSNWLSFVMIGVLASSGVDVGGSTLEIYNICYNIFSPSFRGS
jgi:hypothetical protein